MSSGITVQILGEDKLRRACKKLVNKSENRVATAIRTCAYMVHKDAMDSLTADGKGSGDPAGRVYHGHQASSPGEAPASDTGNLRTGKEGDGVGIIVVMDEDKLGASVIATASYARDLEFGTSKMEPRPFMGPAFNKNKPVMVGIIRAAMAAARGDGGE